MIDAFLLRALAAGIGVALVAGPLGCLVLWRRLAFFGDALAHGALLGVVIGFAAGVDPTASVLATSVAFALLLARLQRQRLLSPDTLLAILSHGSLAAGLVALGLLAALRIDLFAYLFGDILAVGAADLAWIYGVGALALAVLAVLWRPLLSITVHEELARAEGVPAGAVNLALVLVVALFVAVAMKVVGVLLAGALLVLPAATARRFAETPERMAVLASLAGCLAVLAGLVGSALTDAPAGPSIVLAGVALFAAAHIAASLVERRAARR